MGFEEKQASKELILQKLNGKLRLALWGLVVLGTISSLGGLVWWRQSVNKEKKAEESRRAAKEALIQIFVAGFAASDSSRTSQHNEEMQFMAKIYEELTSERLRIQPAKKMDKDVLQKQMEQQGTKK